MGFSASDYIDDLLGQTNYLPPDIFIDDREIPEAKNAYEFFYDPRFIQNCMPPKGLFVRQLQILTNLYAEYCPRCTDMKWFESIDVNESEENFLQKVCLLEYGVCPHCGATKSELYNTGELNVYTQEVGLAGQRSGKSALVSMSMGYTTHKFLKVPNLQRTYNLIPTSPFTMPLVAMSQQKAQENLYNALAAYFEQGNWFKEYTNFLRENQDKYNLEIFAIKETFTRWRHKNILIMPLGPDKRKLRGNTSLAGCVDELGWMIAGQEGGIKFDASEIYASLNNSFMTAKEAYLKLVSEGYSNLPAPMLFNISSPSSKKIKSASYMRNPNMINICTGSITLPGKLIQTFLLTDLQ